MNHKQLEEIRARAEATSRAKYISPNEGVRAVGDRLDLLAELDRKTYLLERATDMHRLARELTTNLEESVRLKRYPSADRIAAQLREIVGPR